MITNDQMNCSIVKYWDKLSGTHKVLTPAVVKITKYRFIKEWSLRAMNSLKQKNRKYQKRENLWIRLVIFDQLGYS